MPGSFDNPEHWRSRANQMRALSKGMTDLVARAGMLQIADQYDRLAVGAEARLRPEKPAA
jgi:hypothetical protein